MQSDYSLLEIVKSVGLGTSAGDFPAAGNQFFTSLDGFGILYLPYYRSGDPSKRIPFGMIMQMVVDLDHTLDLIKNGKIPQVASKQAEVKKFSDGLKALMRT